MNELLDQLEQIGSDLHNALVKMDAIHVSSLSFLQETCLEQIQRELTVNPNQRDGVKERLQKILEIHQRNTLLLENAMRITNHYIHDGLRRNNLSYNELG